MKLNKKFSASEFLRNNMAWVLLAVCCLIFGVISPNFFSLVNIINILNQNAYIIITALGISFIMMSGEVDISVGYAISLNGVVIALLMTKFGMSPVVAVIVAVLLGIVLCLVNMLIAYKLKLQLFMATVGTSTIFQGLAFVMTQSKTISNLPPSFKIIGQGYIGIIPIPVAIALVLLIVVSFILNKTYVGRYVFAIGGNVEAARLAGINVFGMKIFIASIAGFMTGIGAIILSARLGSVTANMGTGLEFTIITAVLLGGVSVRGGEGKISGVVAGVLILAILSNGMQLARLDVYYQFVAKGIIMLAAIGFDVYQLNRRKKITIKTQGGKENIKD
ncbi:ABC transporter permease [Parablautia sp. Marseille-Q6255]|uniref:ABC transporter permease n=1 Tax=Parablautia sp. Marseille-Q6255 TaxID=3039593 RepID=UPI0024BC3987|nr:ABC transporter permease [Parablautia sp. Marseille-Q6255]